MATVNENVQRIKTAKTAIKTAIEGKGVTVPEDALIDTYASKIDEIQQGSDPVLEALTVTSNGSYTPGAGVDGYNKVDVNVPQEGGLDYTGTGYDAADQASLNSKIQAHLDYAKKLYSEWDPSIQGLGSKYIGDNNLVYAPALDARNVDYAGECFKYCEKLRYIPVLDMPKNVNLRYCMFGCYSLTEFPAWDTSKVTDMESLVGYDKNLISVPLLNTSKATNMKNAFENCTSLQEVTLEGGMLPECDCTNIFQGVNTKNGTLYLCMPGDYSPIIEKLPESWTFMFLGEVPLKIRVLKDAVWLSGPQNLVIGGKTLNYDGKGVYSTTLTFTKEGPNPNLDVMLDGVKIGTAKTTLDEQIFETGDNSSVITNKVGADILSIVPEGGNADGWAYDEQVQGVKSAKITGGQITTLKLSIPGAFEMVWGQDSESGYDYAYLCNAAGTDIVSFKGKKTGPEGQETFSGATDDGIIQVTYQKDSSGDSGLDAFWIKSVFWGNYPPYPEV